MNYERTICADRRGKFYLGVSPDNVNHETEFFYLSNAKRQAKEWSDETGIKFYVYEQVTAFKPVS